VSPKPSIVSPKPRPELYARRGCLRVPPDDRRTKGWWKDKHGYEIRFRAQDHSELTMIQGLLRVVGIDAGRPYVTSGGSVLPIYGASRVLRAVLDLGLELKPPRRRTSPAGQSAPRDRSPVASHLRPGSSPPASGDVAGAIADRRQRRIVMRLADRGPLTARELSATRSQLTHLRRHCIVAALPKKGHLPRVWALTLKGIRETRRRR
jgi:hypothetical protein